MLRRSLLRRWKTVLALLILAVTAYGCVFAIRLAAVGVAYKAKMVCSGVFVAARTPEEVVADLDRDDLALLRYFSTRVDPGRRVTVTAFGAITRQAAYHPDTGCALSSITAPAAPSLTVAASATATATHDETPARRDAHKAAGALRQAIDEAFREPDPSHPKRTLAVVIMRDGEILGERYASGIEPSTALIGWSMTKTVMNALVGVLVRDGRLSLSMRAPIAEWQRDDDPRRRITIGDLLHMSSGLHFDEETINPLNDTIRMLLREPDAAAYAARQSLDHEPGTHWQYSSGTTNILSRTIRGLFANDAEYRAFPRRALFEPLGMTSAVLEADESGTFVASSFMYATARDWARFGTLYLQDGVSKGRRILPEGWVTYSRTPAPADPLHHYGAHLWLDVPDGYHGAADDLPDEIFHAAGHEGQFITIVPSRSLVIVRLGRTRYHGAWDQVAFVKRILAATESK